ncbi:single-stranded DNA-binding protein [Candidatus Dojkabacteria bacterium]|nr:single-stranded DNA-binding protein [Candidatus Dojkabacteria bacterium]
MSTSRSLNKVMLVGNLTRDPVLKETSSGATVCTFGVATNTTWKDAENNLQERTEFHNIVAWNKLGEICAQILSTGMLVYLEGELRTRVWDDESGNRHYKTEVKIDDMKLLDKKDREGVGVEQARSTEPADESDEKPETQDKKQEGKREEKPKEKKESEDKAENDEIDQEADDLF